MKEAKYGMVQPRYGRYGICGWDVIVNGIECMLFRTRKLASAWMKKNGYEIIG